MFKSINSLWFSWILVTSIGSAIGFPLGYIIGGFCFPNGVHGEQYIVYSLIVLSICGLAIGFTQWNFFRTRLKNSWMWIPAIAIGLPLGDYIGFFVKDFLIGYVFDWILPFITPTLDGMFIGMLQCLVFQRKFKASLRWILVSGLSWGIVLNQVINKFFLNFTANSFIQNTYLQPLVYGFLIGITIGIISGAFIESTFINPNPKENYLHENAS